MHQPSSMAIICLVGVLIAWLVHPLKLHLRKSTVCVRRPIGLRPLSDRIPSAVQSDSVRRPIGFRPPSDWIPFAVRSDSVRRPIGLRSPSDDLSIKIVAEVSGLRSTKSDTNKYS